MKAQQMSEPATGTAATVAGWKLIGGLAGLSAIGAGAASLVVMCMTHPRDRREWAMGLVSTVMGSVCGGAAVVEKFGLQEWAQSPFGLVAMIGLCFACGLPAWAIVRWWFNYVNKRSGDSITDVADDVRARLPGGQ